jgi:hypothetical protein
MGSEPSRDDDPTGVHALLSSLPEPDPMPQHLVDRINASLAAEQDQRAAAMSGSAVTPLLATARRRPARLMLAMAGVAAAVVLVAVAGSTMFQGNQQTTSASSTALASASSDQSNPALPSLASSAGAAAKAPARDSSKGLEYSSAPRVQILLTVTGTRYTRAGFVTQTRYMGGALLLQRTSRAASQPLSRSSAGPVATTSGLEACLSAIGVSEAQAVRADVAFYEGRPALIIVATTNGKSVSYAVGRQCTPADPAVMRAATRLP